MHKKDCPIYKYMNSGSGVYKRNISSEDFNASCLIWVGIIIVIGIIIGLQ